MSEKLKNAATQAKQAAAEQKERVVEAAAKAKQKAYETERPSAKRD